jgi:hypothetical protein
VSKIIFGNEENTGRFLVEAMNNAGAQGIVGFGKMQATAEQRVDERSVRVPCPGVNGHTRRFVNADDVVIFIKDVEGNGFGFGLKSRARLRIDLDLITAAKFLRILGGLAIEKDQALRDQFLNASAGEFGAVGGDDTIEAKASVGIGDGELD